MPTLFQIIYLIGSTVDLEMNPMLANPPAKPLVPEPATTSWSQPAQDESCGKTPRSQKQLHWGDVGSPCSCTQSLDRQSMCWQVFCFKSPQASFAQYYDFQRYLTFEGAGAAFFFLRNGKIFCKGNHRTINRTVPYILSPKDAAPKHHK
jgi:hypothetical protein